MAELRLCSTTPRFSYRWSKRAVPSGVPVPSRVVHAVSVGTGCGPGVGTGWVYRVGNTGSPSAKDVHPQGDPDSGAGPGSPC